MIAPGLIVAREEIATLLRKIVSSRAVADGIVGRVASEKYHPGDVRSRRRDVYFLNNFCTANANPCRAWGQWET